MEKNNQFQTYLDLKKYFKKISYEQSDFFHIWSVIHYIHILKPIIGKH